MPHQRGETEAYYRRQNVKQRRSRIPITDQTVPAATGPNHDFPAVRIGAGLAAVTAQRINNPGGQVDLFVNGASRATIGTSRTAMGSLAAGDLVHLRIVVGFTGVEEIRFFGNHDQEISRTKIYASNP